MPVRGVDVPEKWANPDVLRWAREDVHLTVEQAAQVSHAAPDEIRAWETGEAAPSLDDLNRLAEVYDCPTGYFFLKAHPVSQAPRLDFRGVAPGKEQALGYESVLRLRQFSRICSLIRMILSESGRPWRVTVPAVPLDRSRLRASVEASLQSLGITAATRQSWADTREAFASWRTAVEGQGVFVLAMRLEPGGLRGASLWERDGPPFILVNREDIETATGRIFTLLHEYAHLLVRRSGITCDFRGQDALGDVEKFANAFAAEAILPREELVQRLHELGYHERRDVWSDSALDKIREPFHASRDTVAILIEDLGLAPPGHYWQRRAEWDRRIPFGRRGPGPSISLTKRERVRNQFGGNTLRVFALGQGQGLLTKADTSEILGMKVEDAEELLTGSTA